MKKWIKKTFYSIITILSISLYNDIITINIIIYIIKSTQEKIIIYVRLAMIFYIFLN